MAYSVKLTSHAARQFDGLPPAVKPRIAEALCKLADEPRPPGCKKRAGAWLLRIGDYLVIYDVNNNAQLVTVYKIGHRRYVYRDLGL
jgi:mRNA interferase RelE/StbE